MNQWICESMCQCVNESMIWWTDDAVNQRTCESKNQWMSELVSWLIKEAIKQRINESMHQWINESVNQWSNKAMSQGSNEAVIQWIHGWMSGLLLCWAILPLRYLFSQLPRYLFCSFCNPSLLFTHPAQCVLQPQLPFRIAQTWQYVEKLPYTMPLATSSFHLA